LITAIAAILNKGTAKNFIFRCIAEGIDPIPERQINYTLLFYGCSREKGDAIPAPGATKGERAGEKQNCMILKGIAAFMQLDLPLAYYKRMFSETLIVLFRVLGTRC
jgi:hypothetical protein